jgi:hypothetical protein
MSHSKRPLPTSPAATHDIPARIARRSARAAASKRFLASPHRQAWIRAQRKSLTVSRRTHDTV